MIEKERLEELIKNCAVIYGIEYNQIEIYDLSDTDICMSPANFRDYGLRVFNSLGYWNDIRFECLFETIEEAEWHIEFGCIERTERLELPTWECMQPKEDEQDVYYNFYNYNHELMGIRVTKQCIALYKSYRCSDLTSTIDIFDNTKENYTLACRKCVELFKGEKK